jgi:membrane protein implicated in regulation of membrane protease activity
MQWVFLVLALGAALVELQTGTFYLAGVAAVALVTFALGFWVHEELLLFVFTIGCAGALTLVWINRRRLPRGLGLPDLDAGKEVQVAAIGPGEGRLVVTYRGTRWDAVLDEGSPPALGDILCISRKTGSVLHLVAPPGTTHPRSGREAL